MFNHVQRVYVVCMQSYKVLPGSTLAFVVLCAVRLHNSAFSTVLGFRLATCQRMAGRVLVLIVWACRAITPIIPLSVYTCAVFEIAMACTMYRQASFSMPRLTVHRSVHIWDGASTVNATTLVMQLKDLASLVDAMLSATRRDLEMRCTLRSSDVSRLAPNIARLQSDCMMLRHTPYLCPASQCVVLSLQDSEAWLVWS